MNTNQTTPQAATAGWAFPTDRLTRFNFLHTCGHVENRLMRPSDACTLPHSKNGEILSSCKCSTCEPKY